MKYGFFDTGFSIADTLVALAIVGILLSLGAPAYKNYIEVAKRKNVQKMLLSYSLHQESFRLTHFRYASIKEVPIPSDIDYHIEAIDLTEQGFKLIAATKDKSRDNEQCSTFSINQRLERTPQGCW